VDYQRNIPVKFVDEIGLAVYEEMLFEVKVYERMTDRHRKEEKRSQKLTMSLCDR
jgi:hypothetical protein